MTVFSILLGVDMQIDEGLTLALALRCRALILTALGEGEAAINDLKLATANGLETKNSVDYYVKMAKAYASECGNYKIIFKIISNNFSLFSHPFSNG